MLKAKEKRWVLGRWTQGCCDHFIVVMPGLKMLDSALARFSLVVGVVRMKLSREIESIMTQRFFSYIFFNVEFYVLDFL